jgi:very-short-patch-repair endonuclease
MTRPIDIARLLRAVIAAGTKHQLTLEEQQGNAGLLVRCADANHLPEGVSSPYLDRPDSPGSFLVLDTAGDAPRRPRPNEDGVVPDEVQRRYEQQMEAWRSHRDLYNDLFAARTPSEQLELVVAVGMLEHVGADGEQHQRHLVAAPAEITLDQATQRLSVAAADAFRVESNWLAGPLRSPLVEAADDRSNRPLLEVLADEAETYDGATETWRRARAFYGQDTLWEPPGIPQGVVALSVEPVVLLRKKDTSHLLALLNGMVDNLAEGGHVTGPLQMLVDMTADVPDLDVLNDRPALPKAANDEQWSMIDNARRSPHTIIQGPPGTGKTHTIANLAAVLMAEGRRVLITAENDRALREVQGKLPRDMQPLLLPLLKDTADSALARSVAGLIEEADKQRRGARPDVEASLTARRDRLGQDAARTVQQIRRLDALEEQEHELNGQRMRLAGHMIALDGYRDDLATADRYLTSQTADPVDARTLLELRPIVTEADRQLSRLRLPEGLPDSATFAQQLQSIREKLSQLPDRTNFDHSTLDTQVVERLESSLARLATLPAIPYSSIGRSAGEYRNLADDARAVRGDLNHGATANGAEPRDAASYLAAYLDLPDCYTDEPAGLAELHRRACAGGVVPSARLASSSDPVITHERATKLVSRFATDPTSGLLARYVTDLRHRGDSSLKDLAEHATQLAARSGVPPTLPINFSGAAPADHELLEQARGLRDYLAAGGKMTKLIGTPAPVKRAAPLIEHVTVAGSKVDTLDEAEAVAAWLEHRIAVQTARNWAEQHDLTPPTSDVQLKDWLTALSRLPDEAAGLDKELAALLEGCHVPSEAQAKPADELARDVLACAAERVVDELRGFAAARDRLGTSEVRLDGVPLYDEAQAQVAHAHFRSFVRRQAIAAELPPAWTQDRKLHDIAGDDPLEVACEVAAAVADLPGAARPQTLSDATIREVLSRVYSDRRRREVTDEHAAFLGGVRAAFSICTPPSPATVLLGDAVRKEDATAYRQAHDAHVEELERAERATKLRDATDRLKKVHPTLVASFLAGDDDTHDVLLQLGHYQDLLTYRREATALLEQYPDVRELHEHLANVRLEHLKVEAQLASARCWSQAAERLAGNRELVAALSSLQKAERAVPKTRTAKSYQRKLRAMKQATRDAAPAIPCWVMPIDKVAELIGYPTSTSDRFDVVIVDEASQAWFPSAFLYAIAEQVIVVGDDLQTSPANTIVPHDEMVRLVRQHLPQHKLRDALDGAFSLYDVAAAITAPTVMVDHFRCVPPIIELSNNLCYAKRGQRLLPVRVTEPDALTPIKHVRVAGRRNAAGSANAPEIEAIVEKVVECVADPAYDDLTFGVVAYGPNRQAHIKDLRSKLLSKLGPTQMAQRQIEVGSPAQYQGAERNVMFLSLVDVPDANGNVRLWPLELTGNNLRRIQALNVAASRAQDQLWIFHSFGTESLKPNDVRHVLLTPPALDDSATLDAQLTKCQSDFERDVARALGAHPLVAKVRTQVEALGRQIDIVIESYDGRRLAVECDGDAWHTSDADVARDLYRQRTLEAAGGWTFQRFLASEWYADPERIVEQTIDLLGTAPKPSSHPVETDLGEDSIGEMPVDSPSDEIVDDDDLLEDGVKLDALDWDEGDAAVQRRLLDDVEPQSQTSSPRDLDHDTAVNEPRPTRQEGSGRAAAQERGSYDEDAGDSSEEDIDLSAVYCTPAKYEHWDVSTPLPDPIDARRAERADALRQIIEMEGPILGSRLYQLYVRSAGGSKVGSRIKRQLNSTMYHLERGGQIIADDPLDEGGQCPKTYRLPDQAAFVVRERGARTIHEIPPLELAARIRALRQDGDSAEATFRRVLRDYGLSALKSKTRARLEGCAALLDD